MESDELLTKGLSSKGDEASTEGSKAYKLFQAVNLGIGQFIMVRYSYIFPEHSLQIQVDL